MTLGPAGHNSWLNTWTHSYPDYRRHGTRFEYRTGLRIDDLHWKYHHWRMNQSLHFLCSSSKDRAHVGFPSRTVWKQRTIWTPGLCHVLLLRHHTRVDFPNILLLWGLRKHHLAIGWVCFLVKATDRRSTRIQKTGVDWVCQKLRVKGFAALEEFFYILFQIWLFFITFPFITIFVFLFYFFKLRTKLAPKTRWADTNQPVT